MATHGVLSGPAIERIRESALKTFVITDTVPLPPEKQLPNIMVLIPRLDSISLKPRADLFARLSWFRSKRLSLTCK